MMNDLSLAFRRIRNRPGFAATIILTLALGVGATTAAFSLVEGVLLAPLPYADPDGLVMVWERNRPREVAGNVVSPANFFRWRDDARSFRDLAAVLQYSSTLTGAGEAERVGTVAVSPGFFEVLGVQPVLGRPFVGADGEAQAGTQPVLLSNEYWRRRYGGDPSVVGRPLTMNGEPAEIVGVLPPGFEFEMKWSFGWDGPQDVWTPLRFPPEAREATGRYLTVLARLAPGVSLAQARSEAAALSARYEAAFPEAQTGWEVQVVPLHEDVVGDVSRGLVLVFGAVLLVLLIAAANVANLLLARATARQQEVAVRSALGADRGRIAREVLVESSVLAVLGGLGGVVLAYGGIRAVQRLGPEIPRLGEVSMHPGLLAFALAVSLGTGLLFGLIPAIRVTRVAASAALREGERAGSGRSVVRTRGALVVAEMALSLVLLVGAGLLIRSFGNLLDTGVGFPVERVLAADLTLPGSAYPEPERRAALFEALVDRVRSLPGVESASAITFLPLAGSGSATSFWTNDRPIPPDGERPVADIRWVHHEYQRTLDIPLVQGRFFDSRDDAGAPLRVVINRAMAAQFWPDGSAVGRSISMPWGDTLVAEVIGVMGNVRLRGPGEEARAQIYWDHRQFQPFNQMTLVVRSERRPEALTAAVRSEVEALDAALPLYNVRTMRSYLSDSVARARFAMAVLVAFAGIAVVLAAIGIYGVIAYSVAQRTREFGIRMAVGAETRDVLRMVLRQAAVLAGIALAVGAAGAFLAARLVQGLVYGVSATDPPTFIVTAALLAGVALAAAWLPARRAARTDPMRALRTE